MPPALPIDMHCILVQVHLPTVDCLAPSKWRPADNSVVPLVHVPKHFAVGVEQRVRLRSSRGIQPGPAERIRWLPEREQNVDMVDKIAILTRIFAYFRFPVGRLAALPVRQEPCPVSPSTPSMRPVPIRSPDPAGIAGSRAPRAETPPGCQHIALFRPRYL